MEESSEDHRVIPELYFLIAKFLSGGPLKETAETLIKELAKVEVLPRRLDWEGREHAQSYDELASQYSDVSWSRLAAVCARALQLARAAPAAALPPAGGAGGAGGDLMLSARLSLLSDALVRPKPKYSAYREDHSLVRRVATRELGLGRAARSGGAGGPALLSPRMLAGLRLQRRTLGHLSAVYCVVFDRTGRYVLTGADDLLVKVWSAVDGRLLATLRGAGAEITDACVSSDGALLAAGSVERLVRVWCLASAAPRAVLHAHGGTITSVHWAPYAFTDVRWLASTSTDGSVAFWTCSGDGQFLSQPVQYVERMRPGACHMICAAWSAGGGFLAAGSADQHVRVYAVAPHAAPRRVLEVAVHSDAVDSLAWAHRGLCFVSGSKDGSAALWTLHATQWRPQLLRCAPLADAPDKRLKVTMVCWDCSDEYVLTAVSDNTVRVWWTRNCTQVRVLSGHRDEAYVLEPHPSLAGVVLSAGHDGQLLLWDAPRGERLAAFHNDIAGQGDGAIFDAKWGGVASIAATDSHGHLLLLGLGQGHRLLQELPTELFFHTDYRPLVRDALGGALDEQTETPPHLMPPPFLVDVEGAPHPPRCQRLVPGRENLAPDQLVPAAGPAPDRLDMMIAALAAERTPPAQGESGMRGPWRGEGVRHTGGAWQSGEPAEHSTRPIVPPLPPAHLAALQQQGTQLFAWEQQWFRREMRRRPVMISTAPDAGARRKPGRRARPPPRPAPMRAAPPPRRLPPSSPSCSLSSLSASEHSSHSARPRRPERRRVSRAHTRSTHTSDSECSYSSSKSDESSESSYSDWEAGAEMAPPARAKRRPLPASRYSPSTLPARRNATATAGAPGPAAASAAGPAGAAGAPAELPEAYRPGEWLCAVSPRKAPYHPQMADTCLYFRLGHQRYFEAVAEKDMYKVNPRDKPWERTQVHECELVKVVGIKYVIKPPRIVCLKLVCVGEGGGRARSFTVRYHDMPDVIDFLVLRQQYDTATQRHWGQGDRFRCMIDDSWWTGVVLERSVPPPAAAPAPAAPSAPSAWAQQAAAHFLSLKVRWDNGEVERLSPWDLEPLDPERLPAEPGGSVPVLPHELEAVLYRADRDEWPPRGDRAAACRAIAHHISQVMSLSVAEPFVAPVDLQLYPSYAMVVPYPIDLATIRARFENLFYRRTLSAQFDVRYLATNAEQFNEPHSPIVRQARLVTDLLLHIISHWRDVDVVAKYHELAASYHSSDDDSKPQTKSSRSRRAPPSVSWQEVCSGLLGELMRSPDAEPFLRPVSVEQAPDYRCVVPRPLDLGRVQRRLQAGRYPRAARFAADVRRVFANSRLYNTNKRSRIYSMTVRLSALFESLWTRAALTQPGSRPPRRAAARARRRRLTLSEEEQVNGVNGSISVSLTSDSSDSETLAAASRRQRGGAGRGTGAGGAGDSWDSDVPLHKHRKGKGVGKKSKSSSASAEPLPSTSRDPPPHLEEIEEQYIPEQNGVSSDSDDEALARMRGEGGRGEGGGEGEGGASGSSYYDIDVLEETLDDDVDVHYEPEDNGRTTTRKRRKASSASSASLRSARLRAKHARTRERFTAPSSGSSSSSSSAPGPGARHYESDRSYRPRYSTDDDAPLHLYRQRQEEGEAGPSTSAHRPTNRRTRGGGVSLRARRSPRRYNEDSEEDSVACISKRLPHHHSRRRRQESLAHRRHHHAQQLSVLQGAHASDHTYWRPPAPPAPPAPRAASARDHAAHNGTSSAGAGAVSISMRGRVRKLTAKARGLLAD